MKDCCAIPVFSELAAEDFAKPLWSGFAFAAAAIVNGNMAKDLLDVGSTPGPAGLAT